MATERWQRQWDLLHAARDLPLEHRAVFLREQCPDDPELVAEVLSLLGRTPPSGFLEGGSGLAGALPDALSGELLECYRIETVLGEGGMGTVYRAHEEGVLDRPVAIKVVRRGIDTDRVVRRFRAEQETLARLQHPAIASVYQAGATADGRPWFAMEYVDGLAITDWCRQQRLTLEQRLALFARVCDAVQYTHQKGIIHRDLKPSNILVGRDGHIKLIDFGIARAIQGAPEASRLTRQGQQVGTPEYMSPEQTADAADVDIRSDVYSLGVVLYELLTGERPFGDLHGAALNEALRTRDPPTPSQQFAARKQRNDANEKIQAIDDPLRWRRRLKGDLDWVVMKALARERDQRYASIAALATDLQHVLANQPVQARPPSRRYLIGKFVRRHPLGVSAALATTAALMLLSAALWLRGNQLSHALDNAVRERQLAEQIARFMTETFTAADPYEHGGEQISARDLLVSGRARLDALQADPLVKSVLLRTIANTYRRLGDYPQAESAALASLQVLGALPSRDADLARAEALTSLATLSREQARYDAVVDYAQRALVLRSALFGKNSVEAAASLASLGYGWLKQGEYARAEPLLLRAVAIHERHPESEQLPPHVQLARLYVIQGRYEEAEPLYLKSLQLSLERNGPWHAETASRENNLAALYFRMGEDSKAAEHYESALKIQRRNFDEGHPNVLVILNNLGALHVRMEAFDKALPLLEQALAGRRDALGPEHLEVGVTGYHLANALRGLRRYEQAERLYRDSIGIVEIAAGESDRRVGVLLNGLARLQLETGNLTAAQATAQRALDINIAGWPAGHRTPAESRLLLAEIHLAGDRPALAEAQARIALDVLQQDRGAQLPAAVARGVLGRALLQSGDAVAAIPRLRQALDALNHLDRNDSAAAATIQQALGAARARAASVH